MEAWTSGKVSADARRAWLADAARGKRDRPFTAIGGGYRLIAWESEIAMCRAMGRGVAAGKGRAAHRYDRQEG